MRLEIRSLLALLTLGFVFLLGAHPQRAFSAESCAPAGQDRPLVESGDESGIGGTGIHDPRPDRMNSPGDDSESGIGGTGIFGTVTNVDRLCVNGLEIRVPDQILVQTSNSGANDGKLALGMVVWIRATRSEDGLVAEQIQVEAGLAGEIETVSSSGQEFVISGQTIQLPDEAQRGPGVATESLAAGQWLVVYGLRDENEHLVASRLEVDSERRARGGNGLLARALAKAGPLRSVSIEGYVSGRPERPRLAGMELEIPASRPDIQRDAFRPGLRMTAVGRISTEGVFRIERPPIVDRPGRATPLDRETQTTPTAPTAPTAPTTPEIESMDPPSEGQPVEPRSNPQPSTRGKRPRREETKRGGRRPPNPPHIDRPRNRPSVDRPTRIDIERLN